MTAPICSVVELRQYTLHPGGRDVLIDLFEREFVETQEAVGIRVLGQFRDVDDPNRFVWLRGFHDMEARKAALTAFYVDGAAWKAHGPAAGATMVDSDDVHLLRPITSDSGFAAGSERPPIGATPPESRVMATIVHKDEAVDDAFTTFFEDEVAPFLTELGAAPIARFQTEPAENTFPGLPVRTGENVFVWFTCFADAEHHRDHLDHLARTPEWTTHIQPALAPTLKRLTLAPTARSLLR
ncbi:NIPSNAP family protein [Actinomadura soli]|uniref:NIPSNAP family protein n=1 Tax=Actinomadura soli TaxID=2508997 RepID=A0A5C4JG47_9ACTN|nr:NIPSNAP family protein [Actinomadura soli]TMR03455.1 NIPSNAP family protein [Actinomadura soli]